MPPLDKSSSFSSLTSHPDRTRLRRAQSCPSMREKTVKASQSTYDPNQYVPFDKEILGEKVAEKMEDIAAKLHPYVSKSSSDLKDKFLENMHSYIADSVVYVPVTETPENRTIGEIANQTSLKTLDRMIDYYISKSPEESTEFLEKFFKSFEDKINGSFTRHTNMTDDFFTIKMENITRKALSVLSDKELSFEDIMTDIIGQGRQEIAEIGDGSNDHEYGIPRTHGLKTALGWQYREPKLEFLTKLKARLKDQVLPSGRVTAFIPYFRGGDDIKINLTSSYVFTDMPRKKINPYGKKIPFEIASAIGDLEENRQRAFYSEDPELHIQYEGKNIFMGLSHTEAESLEYLLSVGQSFLDIYRSDLKKGNKEDAFMHAASLIYLFNHMCPFERGSAAGGEVFAEALMKHLFPEKQNISFKKSFTDFKAFHSSLQDFTDFLAKKVGFEPIDPVNQDSQFFDIKISQI